MMLYNYDGKGVLVIGSADKIEKTPVVFKPGIHSMEQTDWNEAVKNPQIKQLCDENKIQLLSKKNKPVADAIDIENMSIDKLAGLVDGIFDPKTIETLIEKENRRDGDARKQVKALLEDQLYQLKGLADG